MFSAIMPSRKSTESTRTSSSSGSERSLRCPTPTYVPPSISYGGPTRPNIELCKPVWEVDSTNQTDSVTGEIEVNVSMFRRRNGRGEEILLPFSIGIHFTKASSGATRRRINKSKKPKTTLATSPISSSSLSSSDSEDSDSTYDDFRGEWNQDGPGNYYRRRSFIQIHQRLIVDDICYTKFTINIPQLLLPAPNDSQIYNVSVKAYELGDPFNVTEPSVARFMVLNQADAVSLPQSHEDEKKSTMGIRFSRILSFDDGEDTDDSDAGQSERRMIPGCGAQWKITRSLSLVRKKRTSQSVRYPFLF